LHRTYQYYRMKADQEWEMAGLARQDNDMKASEEHTRKAREYEALAYDMRPEKK
jgi:hypothetical protein